MNKANIFNWALRIIAALIMFQTLYFKFTAQEESVQLFTTLGMEPWGRIGIGVLELVACILLIVPRTVLLGALLGIGLMSGAIFFHLTKLGINFGGDSLLFSYAVIVFVACSVLAFSYRKQFTQLLPLKF